VGIYKHFFPSDNEEVLVFKITESEDELFQQINHPTVKNKLGGIKAPQKRLEFLARNLIFQLKFLDLSLLSKNEFGAPLLLKGNDHISFSHSFPFVCMYINKVKQCGIDVERIQDKIVRISPKFLNSGELSFTESLPEKITMVWSAKEVAFKIYQKGGVDFKEHIQLNYAGSKLTGLFLKATPQKIKYDYMFFENHILIYGVFE